MSPPWASHLFSDLSLLPVDEEAVFCNHTTSCVRLKLHFLFEPLESCSPALESKMFQNGAEWLDLSAAASPKVCLSSKPRSWRGLRVNIPFCHKF